METRVTSYFIEKDNGVNTFNITGDSLFFVNENTDNTIDIEIKKDNTNIIFEVNPNANVKVRFLFLDDIDSISFKADLKENSSLDIIVADFSNNINLFKSLVNLNETNASSKFVLSTLVNKENKKKFDISFEHNVGQTASEIDAYGVCKDNGNLEINGVTHIAQDAKNAEANEKVKVILFDETSLAKANPILKIDCNDVIAKHACAIGSINEDHIYYLLTRGLNIDEARSLITLGYLLPIANYFDSSKKEKILDLIGGSF